MLADHRPFLKILWRKGSVFLNLVLNAVTETVEMMCSRLLGSSDIIVGAGEIVICRIIRISIEVWEYCYNIYGMLKAVACEERCVMVSCKGDSELLIKIEIAAIFRDTAIARRSVVYTVEGLYFAYFLLKIYRDFIHYFYLPFWKFYLEEL